MFDDRNYDYTQHLKDIGAPGGVFIAATNLPSATKKKDGFLKDDTSSLSGRRDPYTVNLPAEALPSEFEMDVGMLNLAAPVTGNPFVLCGCGTED